MSTFEVQWSSGYDLCLTPVRKYTEGRKFDPCLSHIFVFLAFLSHASHFSHELHGLCPHNGSNLWALAVLFPSKMEPSFSSQRVPPAAYAVHSVLDFDVAATQHLQSFEYILVDAHRDNAELYQSKFTAP